MADVDITSLSVEISAESSGAELNIDKLATAISNLRTKGNVAKVCDSLSKLTDSLATLKAAQGDFSGLESVTRFIDGISKVNASESAKGISTLAKSITKLPESLTGMGTISDSVDTLLDVTDAFDLMATIQDPKGLKNAINVIKKIPEAVSGVQGISSDLGDVKSVLNGFNSLPAVAAPEGLSSFVSLLRRIPKAVSEANKADYTQLAESSRQLMSSLAPLSVLDFSNLKNLGSVLNQLNKVPDLAQKLDTKTVDEFSTACQKLSNSLAPLASQLDKAGNAFAKLPPQLSKVVTQANRVAKANEKAGKSYLSLSSQMNGFMKRAAQLVSLKAIADYIGKVVVKFNDYYEAANLFGVSMKNLTGEASTFINKMEDLLGIDPTEAMNNMATIQSLTTSFGLASDKAYVLSKNLTQLGYDLASLKNIPVAESFTKIQAAISGELEPIRRLGVDLSQARLQQELLALGFTQNVSTLSQADKAVLRYIAIMKQTTDAQGDFARTISSPANQIRVLQAQLESLGRAVGSVLYPVLSSILPPLIAAVELVKELVQWIAKLMDVKVEFPDFSNTTADIGGVSDALDDTTDSTKKAAKALKDYTMGFDELNIIDPTQGSSGSGSGSGATGNILGDVDLSGYDMFKDYVGNSVDEIKAKLEKLAPLVAGIAAGFAAWKIGNAVVAAISAIEASGGSIAAILAGINPVVAMVAAAVALATARIVDLYQKSESFRKGLERISEIIKTIKERFESGFLSSLTDGKLGQALDHLKESFENLKEAIWNLLPESVQEAIKNFSDWIKQIGLDFTDLAIILIGLNSGNVFLLAFEGLTIALRQLGILSDEDSDKLQSGLGNAFESVGQAIADFFAGFVDAIASFFDWVAQIPEKVGSAITAAGEFFSSLPGKIGAAVSSAANKVKEWASGLITTVKTEIPKVISAVIEFFSSLPNKIAYAIGFAVGTLVKWATELYNTAVTEVPKIISAVEQFFTELPGKIWTAITGAYQKFTDWVSGVWKILSEEVPKIISNVVTFFVELPGKILDAITGAYQKVADWASGMKRKAEEVLPSVIENFISFFKGIPDGLKALGTNIVDGLINGVTDAMHLVADKISGLANSFVDGFKQALGIHSPSKVFHDIGEYVDMGLANGITAGLNFVNEAMNGLVNAVADKGQEFIDSGYNTAVSYVDNLENTLNSEWERINNSLSSDFFGSIQTLDKALSNGDLETLGKWAASYFWHAMDDEQKKQIESIANNALTWLKDGLGDVWKNVAGLASSYVGKLVPATATATTAQLGLNTAMDANPIMLVISLIGMLVGSLINFSKTNDNVGNNFKKVWINLKIFFSYIVEAFAYMMGAFLQGFINLINGAIWAYNKVVGLFGGKGVDYVKNPAFEAAKNISEKRDEWKKELESIGKESSSSEPSKTGTGIDNSELDALKQRLADQEAKNRELSEQIRKLQNSSNVPGTTEWNNNNSASGSYSSSTSVSVNINEEEMRESVYNGTYNALLDIFQRYGEELTGGKEMKIYLDGRQLTASVEKNQNSRGKSLMGSEVYSY